MYSLNVPVPPEVAALASDLARDLPGARSRARGEHTLVLKRLTGDDTTADGYARLEARARDVLRGAPAPAARITGVDRFDEAASGPSPVVYLAVESPGLRTLHARLVEAFDPVDGVEGDDYVPHVTVARGGSPDVVERACNADVDPVEWTVSQLQFYDAERGQPVSTLALPT
ncbi:MAG: 2'-5' RNA ligase family protein [Haloarculaceae archaeon]